jgi:integrase
VVPRLGGLRVRNLRRVHVKRLLDELVQRKKADGSAYSRDTLRLARASLSMLCSEAIGDGLLTQNPCQQFRRGQGPRLPEPARSLDDRQIRPMDWAQREAFLAVLRSGRAAGTLPVPQAVLLVVLLKTGLRPAEALGLRPADIELTRGLLRVERSLELGSRRLRPTKTYQRRTVDLSTDLRGLLGEHLAWLREEALGKGWGECEWLFPSTTGGPLDHNNLARLYRRLLVRAGLPGFRLYDLRHTFASGLLARGAPLSYVSRQLGHRDATTTLRHYVQWIPTEGRSYVDALDSPEPGSGESGSKTPDLVAAAARGIPPKPLILIGEPPRNRTLNLEIKRHSLAALSGTS